MKNSKSMTLTYTISGGLRDIKLFVIMFRSASYTTTKVLYKQHEWTHWRKFKLNFVEVKKMREKLREFGGL